MISRGGECVDDGVPSMVRPRPVPAQPQLPPYPPSFLAMAKSSVGVLTPSDYEGCGA